MEPLSGKQKLRHGALNHMDVEDENIEMCSFAGVNGHHAFKSGLCEMLTEVIDSFNHVVKKIDDMAEMEQVPRQS